MSLHAVKESLFHCTFSDFNSINIKPKIIIVNIR